MRYALQCQQFRNQGKQENKKTTTIGTFFWLAQLIGNLYEPGSTYCIVDIAGGLLL